MSREIALLLLWLPLFLFGCQGQENILPLEGTWKFAIDPNDIGTQENWASKILPDKIVLPGSLQMQGFGDDIGLNTPWVGQIVDSSWYHSPVYAPYRKSGNIKIPFCLTPEKHYTGVAWYQCEVNVPKRWEGKPILLNLERPHWQTTLYIDGKPFGQSQNSLAIPHRFELENLSAGKHLITLKIDNRMIIQVGINSHSMTDHTQTNWNGIIGQLFLEVKPQVFQSEVQIFPDIRQHQAKVVLKIENRATETQLATITLNAEITESKKVHIKAHQIQVEVKPGVTSQEIIFPMGNQVKLWSEFSPNLYDLVSTVECSGASDRRTTTFGMREIKAEGRRFTVNGSPVFLRGTLESCIFPLTGYPSMESDYWEKIYRAVKTYGLNHVRFHSWCPPKVAFDVADRMGVYLQIECCAWALTGEGTDFDTWVFTESDRIISEYGNHPSFFSLLSGNEPGGDKSAVLLDSLNCYWKRKKDNRRMYSSASGWPYVPSADFYSTAEPRLQAWGEGLRSIINAHAPQTTYDFREIIQKVSIPTVSHEVGQWCVYPDYREIKKYTGFLKAKNFEIYRDFLKNKGMEDLAHQFQMASGKLQALCYKADIETALRTPEFAGFQLLDLHDYPGHGSAVIGVLDPFWDPKEYINAKEYRMFCNSTVPLARISKLLWGNEETFTAKLEVAHFEEKPTPDALIEWEISDLQGTIYQKGHFRKSLPVDNCIELGNIAMPLQRFSKATQLRLQVRINDLTALNQWDFWVYPTTLTIVPEAVLITGKLDASARSLLMSGGKVLLTLAPGSVRADRGGDIAVGFSPIFWNSAYTSNQPPNLLGILCDETHPALAEFPTSYHSDYQWWELLNKSQAMVLDDFPTSFRPIVHLIDDWYKNRKLGILFEAKIGRGKLLVTSADLNGNLENCLSARQFKYSLIKYMNSDRFSPTDSIELKLVEDLLKK